MQTIDYTSAAARLRSKLSGRVIVPGDDEYPQASTVWNGAVRRRPAIIVECLTVGDVQESVRTAASG